MQRRCGKCRKEFKAKDGRDFCTDMCAGSYLNLYQAAPPPGKQRNIHVGFERRTKVRSLAPQTKADLHARGKGRDYVNKIIRRHAHTVFSHMSMKRACLLCLDRAEICHIKAIKDFADDVPLSVINDPDNLIALCFKHHKEFDSGRITLEYISNNHRA